MSSTQAVHTIGYCCAMVRGRPWARPSNVLTESADLLVQSPVDTYPGSCTISTVIPCGITGNGDPVLLPPFLPSSIILSLPFLLPPPLSPSSHPPFLYPLPLLLLCPPFLPPSFPLICVSPLRSLPLLPLLPPSPLSIPLFENLSHQKETRNSFIVDRRVGRKRRRLSCNS